MSTATEPGAITWRTSSYSGGNGACVEVGWRTSSYSAGNGDCVEVGWRTSSHSGTNGNCVEVAPAVDVVLVRDSKDRGGAELRFPAQHWRAFLTTVTTPATA